MLFLHLPYIGILFMGFTSLADIVTDILFIQSLFDDGETTWGSVALAIFGINYVVGILQAVFDSERTFFSILSSMFLLEKSLLAFSGAYAYSAVVVLTSFYDVHKELCQQDVCSTSDDDEEHRCTNFANRRKFIGCSLRAVLNIQQCLPVGQL